MRIALFYCTVHFSTQEPETLFESKNYLDFFVVLVHFFLVCGFFSLFYWGF